MGEPLKTFFSAGVVRRLADHLVRAKASFPAKAFVRQATTGLDDLELLARGEHIARALADHLPAEYPRALDILLRSLGPEHGGDELVGNGMTPFFYLPHTMFVARHGLDHFELSLRAQVELTKRFTCEFSIRAFIAKEPERTMAALFGFALDANAHVRRLASEGTRLRLPWGTRVAWLDQHPERVVALLEVLKDDPTTLVRRSVANNLNDLGKVHPELLIRTCAAWLEGASPLRRALVEHALRSAVKRGLPEALALLGFGRKAAVALEDVRFEPRRVRIGANVVLTFALRSAAHTEQDLLVDAAVHFIKASGNPSAKVFKIQRVTLAARATATLRLRISLAVHTTRQPYPGPHRVDILVNGTPLPAGSFDVRR